MNNTSKTIIKDQIAFNNTIYTKKSVKKLTSFGWLRMKLALS